MQFINGPGREDNSEYIDYKGCVFKKQTNVELSKWKFSIYEDLRGLTNTYPKKKKFKYSILEKYQRDVQTELI